MPNKRSNRKKTQHFCCVFCGQRLWRSGTPKHFLFYQDASEIRSNCHISRKNSVFLATKGCYVNPNSWIEEFFCGEHGKIWMLVSKKADGRLAAVPATSYHWKNTTGTIDPSIPNPSVSEFSYQISRGANVQSLKKFSTHSNHSK